MLTHFNSTLLLHLILRKDVWPWCDLNLWKSHAMTWQVTEVCNLSLIGWQTSVKLSEWIYGSFFPMWKQILFIAIKTKKMFKPTFFGPKDTKNAWSACSVWCPLLLPSTVQDQTPRVLETPGLRQRQLSKVSPPFTG